MALTFVGLVASQQDISGKWWWRLFALMVPKMWLRPTILNGLRLLINPTDWSQTVIFEEIFLKLNYDLDRVKFKPEVVFDCGAHIGMFSLLAKSKFPSARLIAFEPNQKNNELLRSQVKCNDLDIELFESAISTETRETFFTAGNSHSGKLLENKLSPETYKVQVVNFPEFFREMRPASVLIKMDIEGEERNILPLLIPLLPSQSAVFFETHSGEPGWNEMEALLNGSGFHVEQINARGQFYDGFAYRE